MILTMNQEDSWLERSSQSRIHVGILFRFASLI